MSTLRDMWGCVMTDSDNAYACDVCGGPTVPQAFSAGREYWCDACDTTFVYAHEREAHETARITHDRTAQLERTVVEWQATSREWEDLAGEWEARARTALEGMREANDAMSVWRARALEAESKLRALSMARDDKDTKEGT